MHRGSELRSSAEKLLASDRNIGEFLAVPAIQLESGDAPEDPPDGLVGPYPIVRKIGRGGMGTVYLADRADGEYRKQVAIKLVTPTVTPEHVLRRFRRERQVLADLDHSNICQASGWRRDRGRPS